MKLSVSSIKKIAVFRALQLGDMLCAIPAIRALRQAYPTAHITLLGLPWSKFLVSRFPNYFDEFVHFAGYPGLPEQPFNADHFLNFLQEMQTADYDLVLQMQGNGNLVNPMVELFGATHTAGFYYKDLYRPDNGLFVEYPENVHEIERHLSLMQHLGIPLAGKQMEFPLYEQDAEELHALNLPISSRSYVCIHPGSRGAWRQWPPAHFAAIGDYCAAKGYTVIITGTRDELDITSHVASLMTEDAINLAGKTSLGALGVMIRDALLLVSNCTGVSHVAAATETPSIVISMDGEPKRWGPLNHQLHRTIDWTMTHDFEIVKKELKDLLGIYGRMNQIRNDVSRVIADS